MRRIRPRKFSVRLISTELIPTRLIFTKEAYRAAPFSLQGTTFVLFNYIVPKYLKPTISKTTCRLLPNITISVCDFEGGSGQGVKISEKLLSMVYGWPHEEY